jgi:serine phosphatase RsbU (regulator of sigma subunit)
LNWKTLRYLIGATSAPLGAPAQKVLMTETVATPQTRLVLLTDGITERLDSNGKMLNERNFGKMLLDAHSMNPHMQKDFLKELLRRSDQLANSAALADDITVVALDFI